MKTLASPGPCLASPTDPRLRGRGDQAGGTTEVSVNDLHPRPRELARSPGAGTGIRVPGQAVRSQQFDIAIEATGAPL